jgi:hypothetical protein
MQSPPPGAPPRPPLDPDRPAPRAATAPGSRAAGLSGRRPAWPPSAFSMEPDAREAAASRPTRAKGNTRPALSGADRTRMERRRLVRGS